MEPIRICIEPYSNMKDHLKHRETIANWIYNEFIRNIRHGITYENVYSRFEAGRPGCLPMHFVALDKETGACVGTVSLVENDLKCRNYIPWLASLVVDKTCRNRGIGRLLIETVKNAAWDLGYETLYLRTETAGGYYRKLGWQYVEQCVDEYGLEPEVYRWDK